MLIFRSDEFPLISISQKPKNYLFPYLPNFLSLFKCTWKFTFLSVSFTEEQAKGEGQAYLHLTVTRSSILTNQAYVFTSIYSLESFGKIRVLSVTWERHSVQIICTLRNICWKRPENSLPSAFPSIFQAVQKLFSGQKCRKNSCVIQCWCCCSSQMGAQEELGVFFPLL